ncbi:MAG: putative aminohydrolase SsnA, partial [Deltaproteobacteria bacterium]|nr:putative aminohydrolase SsnA [Deltaproteobacteria bacterium]
MTDSWLIVHGRVITLGQSRRILDDGALLIQGDRIAEVGPSAELMAKHPGLPTLDAAGKAVMPGLINAHHHLYSTFACGISCEPAANFVEILQKLWWRLDRALSMEDVRYSASIPVIRCIRSGCTTFIDHHASPGALRGSLSTIAEATTKAGLRAAMAYEVTDRNGLDEAAAGIAENAEFIAGLRRQQDPLLAGLFGLHASMTLSPATLDAAARAAADLDTGFHVHVAEDRADQQDSLERYGLRVVQRFRQHGLLGPKTLAVHCIHVDAAEREILAATDTTVVHNPQSNMNNAVGWADALGMLAQGLRVGLGTDGMTSSMFDEVRVANLIHRHVQGDPRVAFVEVIDMLTRNNAEIASRTFGLPLGALEPGGMADIILLDYRPFTPFSAGNY